MIGFRNREWVMTPEIIAAARARCSQSDIAQCLKSGGFDERWTPYPDETPCFNWSSHATPLSPEQIVAVADELAERVSDRRSYVITKEGRRFVREIAQVEPIFVRGLCAWQGTEDGSFVIYSENLTGVPTIKIPSPLRAAPNSKSGIFGNSGARLSVDAVRDLRDQLSAWLDQVERDYPRPARSTETI